MFSIHSCFSKSQLLWRASCYIIYRLFFSRFNRFTEQRKKFSFSRMLPACFTNNLILHQVAEIAKPTMMSQDTLHSSSHGVPLQYPPALIDNHHNSCQSCTFSWSNLEEAASRFPFPPAVLKWDHGKTALNVMESSKAKSGFIKIWNRKKKEINVPHSPLYFLPQLSTSPVSLS